MYFAPIMFATSPCALVKLSSGLLYLAISVYLVPADYLDSQVHVEVISFSIPPSL